MKQMKGPRQPNDVRPLVRLPASMSRCPRDWTVPFDDLVTLRLAHCTACGRESADRGAVLVEDLDAAHSVALRLCLRCHHQGLLDATVALRQQRYRREETG